jgi:signal transduction histidine kinase
MSLRRKLLAMFALTALLSVSAVALIISTLARRSFEKASEARSAVLVAQFRREFRRRGEDVMHRVEAVASSEPATRMTSSLGHELTDYGEYLDYAKTAAETQQLDFLDFIDEQGRIISSAEWPAKFGYKQQLPFMQPPSDPFLMREELPDGIALGMFAAKQVNAGDNRLLVIGGRQLDKKFLAGLDLPAGMRTLLYQNLRSGFSPQFLIDAADPVVKAERLAPLIEEVQQQRSEMVRVIHWSGNAAQDETFDAIPLTGPDQDLLGVLLIGDSHAQYVELDKQIRLAALLSAGAGMLLAILLSGWAAGRVTRPVVGLVHAARQVAKGDWNARVPVTSSDELGELAESFNVMTRELLDHRERLLQAERVAAWRELARRLAHELKNPLFPLQLTVENLLRARQQSPDQFDEIFQESSATLLAEIANLKTIIARFGEFSKMPQPQFQWMQPNDVIREVARLLEAQLQKHSAIECTLELAEPMEPVAADPDMLQRAVLNLALNAVDAMPQGGTITLRTRQKEEGRTCIEVVDTGVGLSKDECARLFTPYYTTKTHGTGLGLAIVQSVVSDHGGKISVRSEAGRGTTFVIELPRNADKVQSYAAVQGVTL